MSGFIPELEIKEIERLVAESLRKDLTGWRDNSFLFTTRGVLDNVSDRKQMALNSRWSKVFGVKLVSDGALMMNAKHTLLESYEDGDYVEVVAYPTISFFNSQLQLQMELVAIRLAETQTQSQQRRADRSRFHALQQLRPRRNVFPMQVTVQVDLIYSSASSAKVDEDFLRSLGAQLRNCEIQRVPVRMSSAEQVATAIAGSGAEVVVLIRGGGADADFEVFNSEIVVEALMSSTAYRIVGLGHSGNSTQLDLIADYSASVPADAGVHLAAQLDNISRFVTQYDLGSEIKPQRSQKGGSPEVGQAEAYAAHHEPASTQSTILGMLLGSRVVWLLVLLIAIVSYFNWWL